VLIDPINIRSISSQKEKEKEKHNMSIKYINSIKQYKEF
jgi:hypothetical protein